MKIGNTEFGSWEDDVMSQPWCRLMWKFNMIVIPTELFLMNWWW